MRRIHTVIINLKLLYLIYFLVNLIYYVLHNVFYCTDPAGIMEHFYCH